MLEFAVEGLDPQRQDSASLNISKYVRPGLFGTNASRLAELEANRPQIVNRIEN